MALEFRGAPEWLLQEYYNRKTPYQEASEGIQTALGSYLSIDESRRKNALAQQQIDMQKQQIDMAKQKQLLDNQKGFLETSNPSYLPPADQAALALPRPEGPATAEGAVPQDSPIIANWRQWMKNVPQGTIGLDVAKTASEVEKNQAMAEMYRTGKTPAGMKPQYRTNPITGEVIEIIPSQAGAPASVNTLTPATGQGPYREVAKAKATAAGESSMVDSVVSEIDRVQALNENAYGGLVGAGTMKVKSALNLGKDDPKFTNTTDVVNTMQAQVARVLKSTFGGQLSDGERAYLNEVYGALPKLSQEERRVAMNNVKTMLVNRRNETTAKYNALAGGGINQPTQAAPASAWDDSKEARYQELLRKRGGQ